jgi:hypothetical protein
VKLENVVLKSFTPTDTKNIDEDITINFDFKRQGLSKLKFCGTGTSYGKSALVDNIKLTKQDYYRIRDRVPFS